MDLSRIIAELRSERDRLDNAILALERLSADNEPGRGRPPNWPKGQAEEDADKPTNSSSRRRGAAAG